MPKIYASLTIGHDDVDFSICQRICSSRNPQHRLSVFSLLGLKQEEKETASEEMVELLKSCRWVRVRILGVLFGRLGQ